MSADSFSKDLLLEVPREKNGHVRIVLQQPFRGDNRDFSDRMKQTHLIRGRVGDVPISESPSIERSTVDFAGIRSHKS